MKHLIIFFEKISYYMHTFSGFLMVVIMTTTMLDICARAVFSISSGSVDLNFIGAVEIVKYSLLIMIFFTLPYSLSNSQIIVDLFTDKMAQRSKDLFSGFYNVGFFLIAIAMSIRFYDTSLTSMNSGETTIDLGIPIYYFYAICSFASLMLAIRSILLAYQQIANIKYLNSTSNDKADAGETL